MKLLILCREPRLYSCQRLLQAALDSGHQVDILDPNRFLLKLNKQAPQFELFYQNTEGECYPLPSYDAVLPRFGVSSTSIGCMLLNHFQALGICCLNESQPFALARDKWQSLQALVSAGLPVPQSILAGIEFSAPQTQQQIPTPSILKTLTGTQGIGVILAEQPQTALSVLETLKQAQIPTLVQEFIEEAKGTDLRCFVVGDQIVAAMQRIGQAGEFRANFHRGGDALQVQLNEQEKRIAIQATKVLGLDVAGVDLIRSKQGPLILEVNASPGLEMIEKTSCIDIAAQIIAFLERKTTSQTNSL